MRTRKFYLVSVFLLFVMGCEKPAENPELRDAIYQDLLSEAERYKKEIESKDKEIEGYKVELESPESIAGQKKIAKENIFNSKSEIFKLRQKLQYFEIAAESRKIYIRKQSLADFKRGVEWMPPDIREDYFLRKNLQFSPKNWMRGAASIKIEQKKEKSEHAPEH